MRTIILALEAAGVEPWTELPLSLPQHYAGTWQVGTQRALAGGPRCRPVAETVRDVGAWLAEGGAERLPGWHPEHRASGLDAARQRELPSTLHGT